MDKGDGTIHAGRAGKVVKVGFDARGYGLYCVLDFGGGWAAWYAHARELYVKEGEWVAEKQPIGVSGSSGASTGVHCHLTLTNAARGLDNYVVAKVVPPEPYLRDW